ncbi:MAG TPA: hypothetical protein PLH98_15645 [Ruminococcus flavefaciens]|nr:hypothetical protein [Ruminococcus flavefaciens]HQM01965.1 hypothetical protein [Ruminococcus flavefaciens]
MDNKDSSPEIKKPRKHLIRTLKKSDGSITAFVLRAGTPKQKVISVRDILTVLSYIFAFGVMMVSVVITLYYVIVASRNEFHSDCTDTLMWANASYESGSVYDPDFKYACFLPFGVNLIMQPLIHLTGLSLTTHILGMTGFFLIITLMFFIMQNVIGTGARGAALGTAVFLAMTLSSRKLREIFWGHTIYYTLGILFLIIGIALYFRIMTKGSSLRRINAKNGDTSGMNYSIALTACIFAVFIMLAATDGISAISIFALPLMAAIAAEYFLDMRNRLFSLNTLYMALRVAAVAVMTLLGIFLNNKLIGDLSAGYQEANSMYSAMSTWSDHLRNLPTAWMSLLGVKSMEGQFLMQGLGLNNLFYIFNAVMLAVIPVIATIFYPKYGRSKFGRAMRYWVWIHWAVTVIVLIGYICGVLAVAEWRLTPIVGTSLILSILFIRWAVTRKTAISRLSVILMLPALIVCCMNLSNAASMPSDPHKRNDLFGLEEFLENMELENGYATFWQANSITVLSGNKVKVREVIINDGTVRKRFYQSSKKWYDDMEGKDEYFLLLTNSEYKHLVDSNSELMNEVSEDLEAVINSHSYHVLIFDHNFV